MTYIVGAYVDGGGALSNPSSLGGSWAVCLVDNRDERCLTYGGLLLPEGSPRRFFTQLPEGCDIEVVHGYTKITNNQAEFYAFLRALEILPDGWSGKVYSDSQVTLGRFLNSWSLDNIPRQWIPRGYAARTRLGAIEGILLDGHPTKSQLREGVGKRGHPVSRHNVWCDARCREICRAVVDPASIERRIATKRETHGGIVV